MPQNQNEAAFNLDVISIHNQTIAVNYYETSEYENEVAFRAFQTFRHLIAPPAGRANDARCSYSEFADKIEANYGIDNQAINETIRVLRAIHERIAARTIGRLAKKMMGIELPIKVLKSGAGFYVGTSDEDGPCSRESEEYWPTQELADEALKSHQWTQRLNP